MNVPVLQLYVHCLIFVIVYHMLCNKILLQFKGAFDKVRVIWFFQRIIFRIQSKTRPEISWSEEFHFGESLKLTWGEIVPTPSQIEPRSDLTEHRKTSFSLDKTNVVAVFYHLSWRQLSWMIAITKNQESWQLFLLIMVLATIQNNQQSVQVKDWPKLVMFGFCYKLLSWTVGSWHSFLDF